MEQPQRRFASPAASGANQLPPVRETRVRPTTTTTTTTTAARRIATSSADKILPSEQLVARPVGARTTPSASGGGGHQSRRSNMSTSGAPSRKMALDKQLAASKQQQQQEVWTSTDDLFWDHMREVQNKWNTLKLNDDIWAKLIYFEQNRRLAKAYVSTPILTIDGSTNGLDGFRIGLSGIENSYRNLDSIASLRTIGHGIKLKIDQHGNILIKKVANPAAAAASGASNQCSIWIKDWPAPTNGRPSQSLTSSASSASSSSSSDYSRLSPLQPWPMLEIVDPDISYKLFDMQKFRHQLERQADSSAGKTSGETLVDWRQCVSIISFVRQLPPISRGGGGGGKTGNQQQQQQQLLGDPCWIMLINIIAIDMLKSSLCDNSYASPKPANQISSMIDRYQFQARRDRPLARKLPDTSMIASTIDEHNTLDKSQQQQQQQLQLRSSASVASLYPTERHTSQRMVINYDVEPDEPQPLALAANSERLKRLNNFNRLGHASNGNLRGLSSSSIRASEQLMAVGNPIRLHKSSQQLSGPNFFIGSPPAAGSVSSASNNAIYTTFTGKYLDKRQRQARQVPRKSSMDDLTRQNFKQPSRDEYLGSPYPSDSTAVQDTDLRRVHQLKAASKWRAPSPLLMERGRLAGDNYQATGRIPFARKPMSESHQKQLSHSLSAFDLSHGHKLNLRSLKSIKMNFDSTNDDDDGNVEPGVDGPETELDKENYLAERGRMHEIRTSQQALSAFNSEALEWANLAKKYALNGAKTKSTSELTDGHPRADEEDEIQNSSSTISSSQLFADEVDDEEEGGNKDGYSPEEVRSKKKQQQHQNQHQQQHKKVSRASMASAASSSSGCADNDYFVSQSSSSMSSSTHTSSGAIDDSPASQPTSSSGIAGSGNTSDDCVGAKQGELGLCSKRGAVKELPIGDLQISGDERPCKVGQHSSRRHLKTHDLGGELHYKQATNYQSSDGPLCDCILEHNDLSHHHQLGDRFDTTCDCCCDCLYQDDQHHGGATERRLPGPYEQAAETCDCGLVEGLADEEPIYDQLPRFGKSQPTTGSAKGKSKLGGRNNSCADLTKYRNDDIVATPTPPDADNASAKIKRAPSKELKRNNGWLERRKYIRLFPRFMFSSSSSSSAGSITACSSPSPPGKLDKGALKPEHLANSRNETKLNSKFRRTRSIQNLS